MFDLSSISSKILYREFRYRKEIPSTAHAKFKDEYPNLSTDWKETYFTESRIGNRNKKFHVSLARIYPVFIGYFSLTALVKTNSIQLSLFRFCERNTETYE